MQITSVLLAVGVDKNLVVSPFRCGDSERVHQSLFTSSLFPRRLGEQRFPVSSRKSIVVDSAAF